MALLASLVGFFHLESGRAKRALLAEAGALARGLRLAEAGDGAPRVALVAPRREGDRAALYCASPIAWLL